MTSDHRPVSYGLGGIFSNADKGSLSQYGLDGWSWRLGRAPILPADSWTWSDGLGMSVRQLGGAEERLLVRSEGIASALVAVQNRLVLVYDVEAEDGQFLHWLTDQVVSRILAHRGDFVVHGGAVVADGARAILITAPSGYGKSTLTAFLNQNGWPILGDDATLLIPTNNGIRARAVYPRLKLRADSWERLYPNASPPNCKPGWKISVDLSALSVPPVLGRSEVPLAAIFCLSSPEDTDVGTVSRLEPGTLCMQLVRNSFALDPANREKAARRLEVASAVASVVPGFHLRYRRDFGQLTQARQLILDALAA